MAPENDAAGEDGAGEGASWRSYRCPVCGHRDGISLEGAESAVIRCTHCDTSLEVARKGLDSVKVTVAGGRRSRRARERS